MNNIQAKEILKDKFWIVESQGEKVGTISLNEEKQYMLTNSAGTKFFKNIKQLASNLDAQIKWTSTEQVEETPADKEVHGYPTSCTPYNPVFDVQQKFALFTKSQKSKSLYCAGYFIIRFDKGWVKSFCPKLITVERYETKGPFRTDMEMKLVLSNVPK
ncbi:hypothetical protein N9D49_00890 [bacterium]|jgi:hypothetical protein|nr:hypothetical protein [bacterium]